MRNREEKIYVRIYTNDEWPFSNCLGGNRFKPPKTPWNTLGILEDHLEEIFEVPVRHTSGISFGNGFDHTFRILDERSSV